MLPNKSYPLEPEVKTIVTDILTLQKQVEELEAKLYEKLSLVINPEFNKEDEKNLLEHPNWTLLKNKRGQ